MWVKLRTKILKKIRSIAKCLDSSKGPRSFVRWERTTNRLYFVVDNMTAKFLVVVNEWTNMSLNYSCAPEIVNKKAIIKLDPKYDFD